MLVDRISQHDWRLEQRNLLVCSGLQQLYTPRAIRSTRVCDILWRTLSPAQIWWQKIHWIISLIDFTLNIYCSRNFLYITNNTRLPDGTFCFQCGGKFSTFLLFKVKHGTDYINIYHRIQQTSSNWPYKE